MEFMNQEFTDFHIDADMLDDGRMELSIHDLDKGEHQALIVNQDAEEVANRLEAAAETIRENEVQN